MSVYQFSIILLTAFGSVAALAYYFANLAEDGINETAKKKFANKFKNLKVSSSTRAAFELFLFASDRFYGNRLFSARAFITSATFSVFWFFSILFISGLWSTMSLLLFSTPYVNNILLKYAIFLLFVGINIDFFSTVMTRVIVRLSLKNFNAPLIFIAIADLFLSSILFYLSFFSAKYIMLHKSFPSITTFVLQWSMPVSIIAEYNDIKNLTGAALSPMIVNGQRVELIYVFPEGVLFLSSLLTSVWLWLYIASYWLHKTALRVDSAKTILLNISNIENKPFKSIGIITLIFIYPIIVIVAVCAFAIYRQFPV
jgi:hypothetical protein